MGWSERQHGLLQAMGVRVWSAPVRVGACAIPAVPKALPVSASVTAPISAPISAPVSAPVSALLSAPVTESARAPFAAALANPGTAPGVVSVQSPAAAAPYAQARSADIRRLDWPALRSAVAECRACGLCESRTQTVFGVGHPHAHWLVVGEAPGEQEDLSGEPFVGAAGRLLDNMLAALRLSRAEGGDATPSQRVYIANTLKCRPPRNRNPTPAELAQCEPFLARQIQLLQPRIILAMGRFAVHALLRSDEAIGKLRGRVHQYQGVPVVVTYHPSYLLRYPPEKARAWEDLCLAAEVVERGPS